MERAHENVVEAQFGPRAKAYVESAVHAQARISTPWKRSFARCAPHARSISVPAAAMSPI